MCACEEPTSRIVWLWTMAEQGRVGPDAQRVLERAASSNR